MLAVVLEPRGLGDRLVDDGLERAVGRGSEGHALPGGGAVPEAEHLLAGERHPDRALQLPRRQHGQEHLVLGAQPRAERPADERRDDAQVVLRVAEHVAEVVLDVLHPLGLVVDGEPAVLVPDHGRRERLHRVVVLDRHRYSASIRTAAAAKAFSAWPRSGGGMPSLGFGS